MQNPKALGIPGLGNKLSQRPYEGGLQMVICPIARMVHCTGCILVKFCPAKTILGDYGKTECATGETSEDESKKACDERSNDNSSIQT